MKKIIIITPSKIDVYFMCFLKYTRNNIPMLEHCAQQSTKFNKEGNYIQVTQSKHHLDIMHNGSKLLVCLKFQCC